MFWEYIYIYIRAVLKRCEASEFLGANLLKCFRDAIHLNLVHLDSILSYRVKCSNSTTTCCSVRSIKTAERISYTKGISKMTLTRSSSSDNITSFFAGPRTAVGRASDS